MQQTIRPENAQRSTHPTLYLAFELSNQEWKLGFTIGRGQSPRQLDARLGKAQAPDPQNETRYPPQRDNRPHRPIDLPTVCLR